MMKKMMVVLVFVLTSVSAVHAEVVSEQWAQAWRDDLDFVKRTLPQTHARLFHTLSETSFNSAIDALNARIPVFSHHEITVEFAAILAAVSDGHTRLTLPMVEGSNFFSGHSKTPLPKEPAIMFNHFPIRLYVYSDGLYVRRIGAEHAVYAGAKVIQIGGMSAREAMRVVARVVHRDNDFQLKHLLPSRLVIPEVLHALKISQSLEEAKFLLETTDGKQHRIVLSPVGEGESVNWVDAGAQSGKVPLYLRDAESNFWFEHLKDQQTIYWQYNEVYDTAKESIADFAMRLTNYIADHKIRRLIIDLRHNSGGNNTLNRSLIHALIRAPELRDPGSLFVIAGRGTFSAAMMFAIDLEKQTNAIFVGEATGASLNHYGDSRRIQLPNSGLTIRVSTLYWQYSGPQDKRLAIKPHIPAELSSQDFHNGRDPAMTAILALFGAQALNMTPKGAWASRVLGYDTVVNVSSPAEGWTANIDFVEMGASGLPLTGVEYQAPLLRFDFPNGDEIISFEGTLKGDIIVGKAIMQGQTYPWVALNK